ncbi:Hypothetical predicted protein [Octopus vulgaris]|uniref:Uncharacterized protein n=1 Tax=Octopus vulgaris TaxID=6645 RepID=A0AA36AXZ5_OCTVU|nr:Hypothetical predicted protein [Octopus vulgaris]
MLSYDTYLTKSFAICGLGDVKFTIPEVGLHFHNFRNIPFHLISVRLHRNSSIKYFHRIYFACCSSLLQLSFQIILCE